MNNDLQKLMDSIGSKYVVSQEAYPELANKTSGQVLVFAIKHSHFHMSKSLGRIATECEEFDHSQSCDLEIIKQATKEMLINTLKLAQELGMTAADLTEAVPNLMKSK